MICEDDCCAMCIVWLSTVPCSLNTEQIFVMNRIQLPTIFKYTNSSLNTEQICVINRIQLSTTGNMFKFINRLLYQINHPDKSANKAVGRKI